MRALKKMGRAGRRYSRCMDDEAQWASLLSLRDHDTLIMEIDRRVLDLPAAARAEWEKLRDATP